MRERCRRGRLQVGRAFPLRMRSNVACLYHIDSHSARVFHTVHTFRLISMILPSTTRRNNPSMLVRSNFAPWLGLVFLA